MDATPQFWKPPTDRGPTPAGTRFGRVGWALAGAMGLAAGAAFLSLRGPAEPFAEVPIRVREAEPPRPAPPVPGTGVSAVDSGGRVKLAPAPIPALVERSQEGLLPRIGEDGTRPAQAYARPAPPIAGPRIAVLVGGLGISQSATADAIAQLPPAVTLAFGPYGTDLERTVAEARAAGHEAMLQVPMEPFDYPDNDPGPHTLTVRSTAQENVQRLRWVMGRFTGYVGLVNTMGSRFLGDEGALGPILAETARRGLVFLDDGSAGRSVVKGGTGRATTRADLVLDAVARPDAIDRELERLETLARERGLAIGTASASPATLDRLARWSKALESRGIHLVPVSSAFDGAARP